MGDVEPIPRSSDSMGLYALPVPRMRSPHRSKEQLRAESAPPVLNPFLPTRVAGDAGSSERAVDELLAHGAKMIAHKRLITGHAETNTQLTFEQRDKKLNGTVSRRDLMRCLRSLALGWDKQQLGLIADRFQLAGSNRCVYEGLVSALHQNDPRKQAAKNARAVARAEEQAAAAAAALARRRAEKQAQLDATRAPLSVPTSGPLTQPLAAPILVGANWRVSPKRPDQCQIGYERSRPGRRAYIESTRDAAGASSMPAWDTSTASGSGSVRDNVTTHGDRHFPIRQLLTPRENSNADTAALRSLRSSLVSEQGEGELTTPTRSRRSSRSRKSTPSSSSQRKRQPQGQKTPPLVHAPAQPVEDGLEYASRASEIRKVPEELEELVRLESRHLLIDLNPEDSKHSERQDASASQGTAMTREQPLPPPSSSIPVGRVDMAVQVELDESFPPFPEPEPEPEPQVEGTSEWLAATSAVGGGSISSSPSPSPSRSRAGSPGLTEWNPGRDPEGHMHVVNQEMSLELLGVKLFNKLYPPCNGRKHTRTPYAKISYAHRMWKSRRTKKSTRRSKQGLSAEQLRPDTPEELSRYRQDAGQSAISRDSSFGDAPSAGMMGGDGARLSPRTGAYVDVDSPLSQHTQPDVMTRRKKREMNQSSADPEGEQLEEGGASASASERSGEAGGGRGAGLGHTWSRYAQPAQASSSSALNRSSGGGGGGGKKQQQQQQPTTKPKKEWEWEWTGARCSWQLLEGPGGPQKLSIDLYADDEHGHDSKIGAVSVSLHEMAAAAAAAAEAGGNGRRNVEGGSGEGVWLRIFSTLRGTRTHKWQGSEESRPEERHADDKWDLPDLQTTTHAAIGAVKVAFSAPGWTEGWEKQHKLFSTVSSVQLAKERAEKRQAQEAAEVAAAAASSLSEAAEEESDEDEEEEEEEEEEP
jgi:hypothetical protein